MSYIPTPEALWRASRLVGADLPKRADEMTDEERSEAFDLLELSARSQGIKLAREHSGVVLPPDAEANRANPAPIEIERIDPMKQPIVVVNRVGDSVATRIAELCKLAPNTMPTVGDFVRFVEGSILFQDSPESAIASIAVLIPRLSAAKAMEILRYGRGEVDAAGIEIKRAPEPQGEGGPDAQAGPPVENTERPPKTPEPAPTETHTQPQSAQAPTERQPEPREEKREEPEPETKHKPFVLCCGCEPVASPGNRALALGADFATGIESRPELIEAIVATITQIGPDFVVVRRDCPWSRDVALALAGGAHTIITAEDE